MPQKPVDARARKLRVLDLRTPGFFSSHGKSKGGVILFILLVAFLKFWPLMGPVSYAPDTAQLGSPRNEPSVPEPESGWYPEFSTLCPFTLSVENAKTAYAFSLRDAETNELVLNGYIRAGERLKGPVPCRSAFLITATGRTWLGPEKLFGSSTVTQRSKDPLVFWDGKNIHGIIVTLGQNVNGNFKQTLLRPEDAYPLLAK